MRQVYVVMMHCYNLHTAWKSGPSEAHSIAHKMSYFSIAFANGNTVQYGGECLLRAQH